MFDYDLPTDRIAQRPLSDRTAARMLYASHSGGELLIDDRCVSELPEILREGDLLILNDSKVLPCRFFATKDGSTAEIEVLLLSEHPSGLDCWEALARPMKRLREGGRLSLAPGLQATVLGRGGANEDRIVLKLEKSVEDGLPMLRTIEALGSMPIPGYIRGGRADEADLIRYQTEFGKFPGSAAAPTAGLHFTAELLNALEGKGIGSAYVTLHVGVASFAPIRDAATHQMAVEWYSIPSETRDRINRTKAAGGRVVAVGTTTVRSLESAASGGTLKFSDDLQSTKLMISPGFNFNVVDLLMTNFHQPKTTHLLLVSAYFGEVFVRRLYAHALQSEYRFLSYGDCMLLDAS